MRPVVHVHDGPDDGQAQARAARPQLRRARRRARSARTRGASRPAAMPTPVSVTMSRAPSGIGQQLHVDPPAAGRELDGVADEVGQHLADARRVVWLADRLGRAGASRGRCPCGRPPAPPAGPRSRRRPAGRPVAGPGRPGPNRAWTSPAGWWPASRAARSGVAICSRNSSRVVGVLAGALAQQLVEGPQRGDGRAQLVGDVGHELAAAVAVGADDVDGLLEPLGHVVERRRPARPAPATRTTSRARGRPGGPRRAAARRVREAPDRAGQPLRQQHAPR